MTFKDAMTVTEASKFLSLDEGTLAQMAEERRIPAIKLHGQWVFSRKSLQKWQRQEARRASRG